MFALIVLALILTLSFLCFKHHPRTKGVYDTKVAPTLATTKARVAKATHAFMHPDTTIVLVPGPKGFPKSYTNDKNV